MPRAVVPLLATVLLVGVTVLLAVAVTVVATGFGLSGPVDHVTLEARADAATGQVTLEHAGGPDLDVTTVSLQVEVDGEPLAHQPPVPFYAATGFNGFPSGPFNPAADPTWSVGEAAAFRVAGSNDPPLVRGGTLTVTVTRDGRMVARATTTIG